MGLEKYQLKANKTETVFTFISEGDKGRILKKVRYTKVKGYKNTYSLGFGDVNKKTGKIDDRIVSDNHDRDKVLATVALTVTLFISRYPNARIYFEGSTDVRNRLYQISIGKHLDELSELFDIQGYNEGKWVSYEKNKNYLAFLIHLKTM